MRSILTHIGNFLLGAERLAKKALFVIAYGGVGAVLCHLVWTLKNSVLGGKFLGPALYQVGLAYTEKVLGLMSASFVPYAPSVMIWAPIAIISYNVIRATLTNTLGTEGRWGEIAGLLQKGVIIASPIASFSISLYYGWSLKAAYLMGGITSGSFAALEMIFVAIMESAEGRKAAAEKASKEAAEKIAAEEAAKQAAEKATKEAAEKKDAVEKAAAKEAAKQEAAKEAAKSPALKPQEQNQITEEPSESAKQPYIPYANLMKETRKLVSSLHPPQTKSEDTIDEPEEAPLLDKRKQSPGSP